MSVRNGLVCVVIVSPLIQSRAARVIQDSTASRLALQSRVRCLRRFRKAPGAAFTRPTRQVREDGLVLRGALGGAAGVNGMTTNARTDWQEVASLEDAQ